MRGYFLLDIINTTSVPKAIMRLNVSVKSIGITSSTGKFPEGKVCPYPSCETSLLFFSIT